MKDHLLTIEEEVEIVQNYVAIQKIRYKDRLDFQTAIPPHFGTYRIPKFTLQPLVENAIKYALEPLSRPCKIRLYGIEKSDCLLLIVEDNGPGMEQPFLEQVRKGEIQTKGEGIGLKNIDERIRMALGEAYGIHIHSEPGRGTKVIVRLPNEKEDHHYA